MAAVSQDSASNLRADALPFSAGLPRDHRPNLRSLRTGGGRELTAFDAGEASTKPCIHNECHSPCEMWEAEDLTGPMLRPERFNKRAYIFEGARMTWVREWLQSAPNFWK